MNAEKDIAWPHGRLEHEYDRSASTLRRSETERQESSRYRMMGSSSGKQDRTSSFLKASIQVLVSKTNTQVMNRVDQGKGRRRRVLPRQ